MHALLVFPLTAEFGWILRIVGKTYTQYLIHKVKIIKYSVCGSKNNT